MRPAAVVLTEQGWGRHWSRESTEGGMGKPLAGSIVETRPQHSFLNFSVFVRLCGLVILRFKLINLLPLSTTYVLCDSFCFCFSIEK